MPAVAQHQRLVAEVVDAHVAEVTAVRDRGDESRRWGIASHVDLVRAVGIVAGDGQRGRCQAESAGLERMGSAIESPASTTIG